MQLRPDDSNVEPHTTAEEGKGDMAIQHASIVINEAVIQAGVDDEILLLNTETGLYYGLQGVSARIWQLLVEGMELPGIFNRLLAEYDVSEDRLRDDVSSFLALLNEKGLACEVNE